MSTLAFGCQVPKFPMQRQALIRLAGTVEVRAQGVVPLYESSVVQAGEIHVRNAMPTPVPSGGWVPASRSGGTGIRLKVVVDIAHDPADCDTSEATFRLEEP
jgi:hypothetical protein